MLHLSDVLENIHIIYIFLMSWKKEHCHSCQSLCSVKFFSEFEYHIKKILRGEKHFYHQQLEFGSFLLSRMLLNFCSIFGLSSESFLAFKGLTHLSELLIACQNYKETTSAHTDWLLDLYARNIKTLQKLPNTLKELPENVKVCPGVHTEALLVTLEVMCRSVTEISWWCQKIGVSFLNLLSLLCHLLETSSLINPC